MSEAITRPAKRRPLKGADAAAAVAAIAGQADEIRRLNAPQHPLQYLPLSCIDVVRNTRQHYDEAAMAELVESIRAYGVMQNITVRPHPETPGRYQLVFGHRRYTGAQRAGLDEIPAIIRPFTDREFLEVQLLENLQRQDVHPADEAVAFAELLDRHGYSAEEIHLKVGKPVKFVLLRAKLVGLVPFWMEALRENRLPLAAAHDLARLPDVAQLEATKVYCYAQNDAGKTIYDAQAVRNYIASHILRDLHQAAFSKTDAALCSAAGPCTACPKRSGASLSLFSDLANKDMCLDGACFTAKKKAFVERRETELTQELGHAPILVSTDYQVKRSGVATSSQWSSSEKDKPGAVEVLVVDGRDAGQLKYVRMSTHEPIATAESLAKTKKAKQAELRAGKINTLHHVLVAAEYWQRLAAGTPVPDAALLRYCRGKIIRYGAPHRDMRAYLVEHFGFSNPEGGTEKMKGGVEPWVNENLQRLSNAQRLGLYFALMAYNEVANYSNSTSLETWAIATGIRVAELRIVATSVVDGKASSPGQLRNMERELQGQFPAAGEEVGRG